MGTKILTVEIPEELYDRFFCIIAEKGGSWRSRREALHEAIDSAVEVALSEFLDRIEKSGQQGSERTASA